MKRITVLLLAALLSVSMAACAQSPAPSASAGQPTAAVTDGPAATPEATAAAEPFGKYPETIEVTAVRSLGATGLELPEGDTLENNIWSRTYEEVLGIRIKYLWTTTDSQYTQKMNIAITSDDLPDIMPVNASQLKMLVDNGQAEEIGGVLKAYSSPFTDQVMNADGGRALKSATFNGGLYAIPQMGTGLGSAHVLWVRTDWLDKLKLKSPQTMDDLMPWPARS
jgi:putative aldouronate transport system substrate-binding protein